MLTAAIDSSKRNVFGLQSDHIYILNCEAARELFKRFDFNEAPDIYKSILHRQTGTPAIIQFVEAVDSEPIILVPDVFSPLNQQNNTHDKLDDHKFFEPLHYPSGRRRHYYWPPRRRLPKRAANWQQTRLQTMRVHMALCRQEMSKL